MNVLRWIKLHGDDSRFEPVPASRPTCAQPGTWTKVDVLCERVKAGEELFHPADLNYFDNEGPC